jgi:hypothetical protein
MRMQGADPARAQLRADVWGAMQTYPAVRGAVTKVVARAAQCTLSAAATRSKPPDPPELGWIPNIGEIAWMVLAHDFEPTRSTAERSSWLTPAYNPGFKKVRRNPK